MAILNRTTKQWQAIDSAHHLHPFTDFKSLAEEGSIIISKADGVHLTNSDGKQLLDAMSGLWCVNIGYGRKSMAEVAYEQMQELPYYNSFFKTATVPSIELARQLAEITPKDLNYAFFSSSGSEANDTVVRMVKRYWDLKNEPTKKTFISREYAYHGSTMIGVSLGGMTGMHDQGGLLPGFSHIMPPYWYKYGESMSQEEFGLYAANKLEERIIELGAENVAAFTQKFEEVVTAQIDPELLIPQIGIDAVLELNQITAKFNQILKQFAPTGPGNMRPVFMSEHVFMTSNSRKIGGDKTHLRLEVFQEDSPLIKLNCIGFGLGAILDELDEGMPFSIVYNIEENHWNGKTTLQLNLKDIKIEN